jgi:transcriptional regulator with XRE-family HTH domain
MAGLSRAYISAIERGHSKRPGADVVRRLELALGPLGTEENAVEMPSALASVVRELGLTAAEASSLAGLRIRGRQPQTRERWDFIYKALLASEPLDLPSSVYGQSKGPDTDS